MAVFLEHPLKNRKFKYLLQQKILNLWNNIYYFPNDFQISHKIVKLDSSNYKFLFYYLLDHVTLRLLLIKELLYIIKKLVYYDRY